MWPRRLPNLKRTLYFALAVSFVFSLHHNGVFDIFGRGVSDADAYIEHDAVVLRNSKGFRYSRLHDEGKSTCDPEDHVLFLKTHKTASSTAAAIIERYGFNRNLTFAVSNTALKFYHGSPFTRNMVQESSSPVIGWKSADGYNMLTNHARFNKAEMDKVVHNAVYITIVRHPVSQLESAFGYFDLGVTMGFDRENQLEKFLEDPGRHFGSNKRGYWQFARNNQLFDLGLDHKFHDSDDVVSQTIDRLDHDFDLVMVSEYFDESVLLMKRLLCWSLDDVLYISKAIRSASHRHQLSDDTRRKIEQWNAADMKMYRRFNESLWRKIQAYGPSFQKDLQEFKATLKLVSEECIEPGKKNTQDRREDKFVLRPHAPAYCEELLMGDVEYTRIIQRRMWDRGILLPNPKWRR